MKKETGTTWKGLLILGLKHLQAKNQENTRISELFEQNKHLQRNIGKMQELLMRPPIDQEKPEENTPGHTD
jgi:hypothetical protein